MKFEVHKDRIMIFRAEEDYIGDVGYKGKLVHLMPVDLTVTELAEILDYMEALEIAAEEIQ